MKIAVIDMGTNTFHLLLAEVQGAKYEVFHKERRSVRIGAKGINKGKIASDAWERGIAAIVEYKQIIDQYQIGRVFATGTSAIRNAGNGVAFVKEIEKRTGIAAEIISGETEAELIHLGVTNALQIDEAPPSLLMDIGGGSIEFILADAKKTYWLQSFEMGGQRMVERFHKNDPISQADIDLLMTYFNKELESLKKVCEKYEPKTLIGCSGIFDTLSDIYLEKAGLPRAEGTSEYPLPMQAFLAIHQELISTTREKRLQIPGMVAFRVEMIVVASLLVNYIIKTLHIRSIRVSGFALKEGVLIMAMNKAKRTVSQN